MLEALKGEWQWRSAAVWAAYERWLATRGGENTLEWAAYKVALDMEERACAAFAAAARRSLAA